MNPFIINNLMDILTGAFILSSIAYLVVLYRNLQQEKKKYSEISFQDNNILPSDSQKFSEDSFSRINNKFDYFLQQLESINQDLRSNLKGDKVELNEIEKEIDKKLFSVTDVSDHTISKEVKLKQIANYFKILNYILNQASEKITILDYILHGKELELANETLSLSDFYKAYYDVIEKVVDENQNVKYTRIIQLPITRPDGYPWTRPEDDFYAESSLEYAIYIMYPPTVRHIVNLLKVNKLKLYLFNDPLRTHSEVIIDKSYWFNELDRYRGNKPIPDSLFINRAGEGDSIKMGMNIEINLIEKCIIENDLESINYDSFIKALKAVQSRMQLTTLKKANQEKEFAEVLSSTGSKKYK